MHPYFSSLLPAALLLGFSYSAAQAQMISRPSATLVVAEGAGSVSIPLTLASPGAAASTV
ncbi:hypothetical protein QMK33_21200 [Hymenobacter sp. H14-R3]|uniref:hypothetical protein n=1 Tax=Hymenobacter sp. H14-R3 TaxID=3046308 RepID=UPI0024B8AC84|nr:hypothetical protein [Hymenobacter sp. H14-R3]MDJ0367671.1 hypothetical protein [Hymenobacter sp. H14-R3]